MGILSTNLANENQQVLGQERNQQVAELMLVFAKQGFSELCVTVHKK